MKALTIIVPAYNMEKYLAKCCESVVVSQELREHLEVLVVNDGSTDKTSEVAHSFERKYPGTFRVIDKPNGHYGSCVNCGLAESKGEFVKLLDADDTYDKAEFERLLKFLVEGSANGALDDIDLVLTDYRIVDKRGKTLRVVSFGGKIDAPFGVDEAARRCVPFAPDCCGISAIARLRESSTPISSGVHSPCAESGRSGICPLPFTVTSRAARGRAYLPRWLGGVRATLSR